MKFPLAAKILGSFALIIILTLVLVAGAGNRFSRVYYNRYESTMDLARARVVGRILGGWIVEAGEALETGRDMPDPPKLLVVPPFSPESLRTDFQGRSQRRSVDGVLDRMGPETVEGPHGLELMVVTDTAGRVLLDTAGYDRNHLSAEKYEGAEVIHDGRTVGYLYLGRLVPGVNPEVRGSYISVVSRFIWFVAAATFLLAMVLGVLLTRNIVRPVKTLNRATTGVGKGDLSIRVPDSRQDELGDLSRGFNSMTAALETADVQRRRLIADSAHELRTPVSLIRARIEMMEEGVYPMDAAGLAALAGESERLVHLVEELRVLADLESPESRMNPVPVDLGGLVSRVADAAAPAVEKTGIVLETVIDGEPVLPEADENHIHRLVTNLVNNALRYAESRIRITAASSASGGGPSETVIRVEDDGPGIPADDRAKVFDRYYRVDASRSRDSGGTGLGLAICLEIAREHGGSISAGESADLGGAILEVKL